jgi:hypothetical protein
MDMSGAVGYGLLRNRVCAEVVPTGRGEKRILKAVGVTARLSDGSSLPEGTFTETYVCGVPAS